MRVPVPVPIAVRMPETMSTGAMLREQGHQGHWGGDEGEGHGGHGGGGEKDRTPPPISSGNIKREGTNTLTPSAPTMLGTATSLAAPVAHGIGGMGGMEGMGGMGAGLQRYGNGGENMPPMAHAGLPQYAPVGRQTMNRSVERDGCSSVHLFMLCVCEWSN
jgi:hypothetical protein